MKKLLLLGGALCLALASLAEDKMKLDLPIVNDPARSSLYFNGSGTARIDSDGQPRTAAIDLDFEHPAEGRYGTLTVSDPAGKVLARYAVTQVQNLSDPTGKRVTLTGVDGTAGRFEANLDFHRDRDRNYSLLLGPDAPAVLGGGERISRLVFDSRLRIAPRVKSAEELARDEQQRHEAEVRNARREAELGEKQSRSEARDTIGALVALLAIGFAVWMAPRAYRRKRLPHLVLFTALALLSTFPPFVLLPVLPAYFWWYRKLYDENYGWFHLDRGFMRIFLWSCGLLTLLFYALFGAVAILYGAGWLLVGYVAYLLIYWAHQEKARCPHCNFYGPNEIVSREFLDEQITRTTTRQKAYSHTEERRTEIIEWYEYRYNVKVEAHQRFRDFRRCAHCGEIFITLYRRTVTLSNRNY